jgi:hypothetical protein
LCDTASAGSALPDSERDLVDRIGAAIGGGDVVPVVAALKQAALLEADQERAGAAAARPLSAQCVAQVAALRRHAAALSARACTQM